MASASVRATEGTRETCRRVTHADLGALALRPPLGNTLLPALALAASGRKQALGWGAGTPAPRPHGS